MKKVFTVITVILGMSVFTQAQVNPHAIGLRLAGGTGSSAEVSFQLGISDANRFEFDFGVYGDRNNNSNSMTITACYHWDMNLTAGLNWFVGPGIGVGLYNGGTDIGLGGQIGLEYDFQDLGAPILLSLDTRPMFGTYGLGWGNALGIRYIF